MGVNNRSALSVYGSRLNRYLRSLYSGSVDDAKSPNSCLATVEAFSNLLVPRFIHVDRGKLSRYYELSLLNTVAKHQDTQPLPYASMVALVD